MPVLDAENEIRDKEGLDPIFTPGISNHGFIEANTSSTTGRVGGAPIYGNINQMILSEIKSAAKKIGMNPIIAEQMFDQFNNAFWQDADVDIFQYHAIIPDRNFREANVTGIMSDAANEFINTEQGISRLLGYARWWYGNKMPGIAEVWSGSSSGSGSGRQGPSGPTEAQIREQFDLDQLGARVDDLYRTYLLTESDDPRGMAKAYVDKIVKNPDQTLDFDEFILGNNIQKENRYASIYKQKPSSMSEQEFLQPYHQTAKQILQPDAAAGAAIGGAQFGASAAQFQERLARSNEYQTSSPFMQGLEGRMSSIKGLLKG